MSLFERLKRIASLDELRLHTPGHKGRLCKYDLTELSDDSFPADEVTGAERKIARVYGARHAQLLSGGSSQGVKAAIYFAGCAGIADVNSHRSVFDGFALSCKRVVTVGVRDSVMPITTAQIDGALSPDIGVVVVTSPTYYGFCADIDGIAEYCKRKGLLFVVDGAHGAHFGFSPKLPRSVADRCDICNLSAHKTLFALTQSAIMLDNLSEDRARALAESARVMGTTSPSYLLYSSVEYAVDRAAEAATAQAYDVLYEYIAELKTRYAFLNNDDFSRLVLDCRAQGVSAQKLNIALAKRGVYSELANDRFIVLIFTAANKPSDVARLSSALANAISETK